MKVIPLGAGQDVGRSCILVSLGDKTVMFDCGMHMGYPDARKFPDFGSIGRGRGSYDGIVDCVIISHFHLDHCGALPYFTERCGYSGPVYMTHPTRAVCPILLSDYQRIAGDRGPSVFSQEDIAKCMEKVVPIGLNETVEVDAGLTICPYYAGHVLGAAMFHVRAGNESVVYTGDYNMAPDRHLEGAWLPTLRPDLLITESTYGAMDRDCRREREKDFVESIVQCVARGGKVLIPVFALGRAQELCLILDTHWERMGLDVPIYSSVGLTQKANEIYKLFINYTNEHLKRNIYKRNLFDFRHIRPFESHVVDAPGPMVIFSSPGMLHSGPSLAAFKKLCGSEKNLVIFPGYCVKGTVGERVINGEKNIVHNGASYPVKLQVKNMPFSAHADQRGILDLVKQCRPRNIVLVHGEKGRMKKLKDVIAKTLDIPTYYPANGSILSIPPPDSVDADIDQGLLDALGSASSGPAMFGGEFTAELAKGKMHITEFASSVRFFYTQRP